MIRKRTLLVITFYTTSAAMAFEKACLSAGIPGRLFPAPRELTSDCGIAWQSPPESEQTIRRMITAGSVEYDQLVLMEV